MKNLQAFDIVKVDRDGDCDQLALRHNGGEVAFVKLNWSPKYKFFALERIPEIQDLYVESDHRGQGYGRALIEYCEGVVAQSGGDRIGIGVGLTASYGAAQRLYVQMGYIPDGFGVTHDRMPVTAGAFKAIDDDMSLMMVKALETRRVSV